MILDLTPVSPCLHLHPQPIPPSLNSLSWLSNASFSQSFQHSSLISAIGPCCVFCSSATGLLTPSLSGLVDSLFHSFAAKCPSFREAPGLSHSHLYSPYIPSSRCSSGCIVVLFDSFLRFLDNHLSYEVISSTVARPRKLWFCLGIRQYNRG